MRKILFTVSILLIGSSLFAGGIVTNTNHSTAFVRMMCRDATLGFDAVYYNPAGLTTLNDGFHLSLSNQYIWQNKTISNTYEGLLNTPRNYSGKVKAPFFPGGYATYKTGKIAISLGFNPIGGGGSAEFAEGLPSFEMPISDLIPMLRSQLTPLDLGVVEAGLPDPGFRNVGGYNAEIYFEGTSVFLGTQINFSYEINDYVSIAIGGRYVAAKNTYQGYIRNVTINTPEAYGGTQPAGDYLRTVASSPFADENTVALLNTTAGMLDQSTANSEVNTEQTGTGFTPIISMNIVPSKQFNVAIKYEFQTKLELETKLIDGQGGGIYLEGEKVIADMPSLLSLGMTYKPVDEFLITAGTHYYLDKNVDYDSSSEIDINMIDKNYIEIALGLEYTLNKQLSISAGWLSGINGTNDNYQSDLNYSLSYNSIGGGLAYHINSMIQLELGASYVKYIDGSKDFQHNMGGTGLMLPVTETYSKDAFSIALGINFSISN